MSDAAVRECRSCGAAFFYEDDLDLLCDCCASYGDGWPVSWPLGTCPKGFLPRPRRCHCICGGPPEDDVDA